jgi:hypothetical protein
MGISSPSKLQLKHIPDVVIMQTVFTLQNTWTVKQINHRLHDQGDRLYRLPGGRLHYEQKGLAHLSEICEALMPLPEKLVWRKLQKLEARGWLYGHGPSGCHYAVADEYWLAKESGH